MSAVGDSPVVAASDADGRFSFPALSPGSYLLRAHRQGYEPAKSRIVHVQSGVRTASRLRLTARAENQESDVLAAGFGPVEGHPGVTPSTGVDTHGHDELAWRLRRARRSVLKDVDTTIAELGSPDAPDGGAFGGLTRVVGGSARYASELFSDLALNGELNLLTTTLFERPQDLLSMGGDVPRGVAYLALAVPGAAGEWSLRGTVTQGALASWMLMGAYERQAPGPHQYEAGLSYAMQRYFGGNAEALAAISDGDRNVGAIYAFDNWTVNPRLQFEYGARYARYDYLPDPGLVSPAASVSVRPLPHDGLTLRVSADHKELAPGAQEFLPPSTGLSLPPSRTFSSVSREAFRAERMDQVEVATEREGPGGVLVGLRAFRQRVLDQGVTLFGAEVSHARAELGHYHVGSVGDVTSTGWGVRVTKALTASLRATLDYSQVDADWGGPSANAARLARLARSVVREDERVRDFTTRVEGTLPSTSTRVFVLYKVSNGFSSRGLDASARELDARFDVQINQALPFLKWTNTRWEMLVAVSNLFNDRAFDGPIYDELLVVRPPTRVLGGVSVRF